MYADVEEDDHEEEGRDCLACRQGDEAGHEDEEAAAVDAWRDAHSSYSFLHGSSLFPI